MTDLHVRVELEKLSAELDTEVAEIGYLGSLGVEELRDLRAVISDALFARHEKAFQPLGNMSKMVPTRIAVKVAEVALGPLVSARVAGAVDTKYAASMAQAMKPDFLAQVAVLIDPVRIRELLPMLPSQLVVEVGRLMVSRGKYLALSRFVPVVSTQDALSVIDGASPEATLRTALYVEEPAALADIIETIDRSALTGVIEHAAASGAADDALTLIDGLSGPALSRVLGLAGDLGPESKQALLEAARRNGVDVVVQALVE